MIKRIVNFQKLLLQSYMGCLFSHNQPTHKYRVNSIILWMLLIPVFAFAIVNGYYLMLYFSTMPIIIVARLINDNRSHLDVLPVSRKFIITNFMITSVLSSLLLIVLFLIVCFVPTVTDFITGKFEFLWFWVYGQMLLIMMFGFCLYIICFAVILLGPKLKIVAGTVVCAALTVGVVYAFQLKNSKGDLFRYLIVDKFGFWPSLAAAAALAALFAFAGLAILPRLMLKRSIANA